MRGPIDFTGTVTLPSTEVRPVTVGRGSPDHTPPSSCPEITFDPLPVPSPNHAAHNFSSRSSATFNRVTLRGGELATSVTRQVPAERRTIPGKAKSWRSRQRSVTTRASYRAFRRRLPPPRQRGPQGGACPVSVRIKARQGNHPQ